MVEIVRGKDDIVIWRGWKKTTTGLLCNSTMTSSSSSIAPSGVRTSGSISTRTTANPRRQRCSSAPFLLQQALNNNNKQVVHNKQGTSCPCCHRRRSSREILSRCSSCPPPHPSHDSRSTTSNADTRSGSRRKIPTTTVKTITKHKMSNNNLWWYQHGQMRQRQRERNQHFLLQKKHLDVSMVGNFYEGSKSRHARHRLVLREVDASNAVALRKGGAAKEVDGDTGITARTSISRRRNGTGTGTGTSQCLVPVVRMGVPNCKQTSGDSFAEKRGKREIDV